jgi:hypothetical protein
MNGHAQDGAQAGKPLRLEHDTVESSNGWFHRVFLVPDGTSALKGDDDFGVLEIHQETALQARKCILSSNAPPSPSRARTCSTKALRFTPH